MFAPGALGTTGGRRAGRDLRKLEGDVKTRGALGRLERGWGGHGSMYCV